MRLTPLHLRRIAVGGQCLLIVLCTVWALFERPAPIVNIRWREGLSAEALRQAERELYVEEYVENGNEGHYEVQSPRRRHIAAIVAHPDVEDTFRIDRAQATITADSYPSSRRVWWAGPFYGPRSPVQFRVLAALIGLVTVVCAWISGPRPPKLFAVSSLPAVPKHRRRGE
jgi:hypothetical protein